jgi:hypothetical protein
MLLVMIPLQIIFLCEIEQKITHLLHHIDNNKTIDIHMEKISHTLNIIYNTATYDIFMVILFYYKTISHYNLSFCV